MGERITGEVAKTVARERGKALRARLNAAERVRRSALIVERVRVELDWGTYRRVHLFLPIASLREVDTWGLLTWIWRMYPKIHTYVPRLTGNTLEHVEVTSNTHFGPNALGIPEPMSGHVLAGHKKLDLVLAPLLAFDAQGHRVGYGGGHYDRFLARHPEALKVGLAFAGSLVPEGIADERHDVPLQQVITEDARYRAGSLSG